MRPNSNTVAKYAAVLFLFPAMLIAGCEQHNKQQNQQRNSAQATKPTQEQFAGVGRVRLRTVCADDIQKYCASADRKKRCLRENIDKLSDACKAAVGQRGGRKARNNDGNDE
jgi:hypothetical protein